MSESEEFLGVATNEQISTTASEIRWSQKIFMVIASWITGLLIAYPDPRAIHFIPLFPAGLIIVICKLMGRDHPPDDRLLIIGWLLYVVLTITTLAMTRKKWFYAVWLSMTILLILSGVSCLSTLRGFNSIH